jgi:hypothetical protein
VPPPREEPYMTLPDMRLKSVTIELDFMHPLWPSRCRRPQTCQRGLDVRGHGQPLCRRESAGAALCGTVMDVGILPLRTRYSHIVSTPSEARLFLPTSHHQK